MRLHSREAGSGDTLLIVHGLFGSSRNWMSVAPKLSEDRHVVTVDLRNHGDSPHAASMSLTDLADDLAELIEEPVDILGHSLGGKAAMTLALTRPEMVRRLIVADIAPVTYPAVHAQTIAAMQAVPIGEVRNRREADDWLAREIEDSRVRRFLLTNLVRVDAGFRWRLNLDALGRWIEALSGFEASGSFAGPALFLDGERSHYIGDEQVAAIRERFPNCALQTIADAGHWIHADQPTVMVAAVREFLA